MLMAPGIWTLAMGGIGYLIRNSEGVCSLAVSSYTMAPSMLYIELLAIKSAMHYIYTKEDASITVWIIESACLRVINLIHNRNEALRITHSKFSQRWTS